jgi:hypothetical protein
MALGFGESWVEEPVRGAALWCPPGRWHLRLSDQRLCVPALLRIIGPARVPAVWRGTRRVAGAHPTAPHPYLVHLGVEPAP